jgi:hypothetical protein
MSDVMRETVVEVVVVVVGRGARVVNCRIVVEVVAVVVTAVLSTVCVVGAAVVAGTVEVVGCRVVVLRGLIAGKVGTTISGEVKASVTVWSSFSVVVVVVVAVVAVTEFGQ